MDLSKLAGELGSMINSAGGMGTIENIAEHIGERAGIQPAIIRTLMQKAQEISADGRVNADDARQQLSELAAAHGVSPDAIGHVVNAVTTAVVKK